MSSGFITTYLVLRLLVRRGFLDIYPFSVRKSTEDNFRIADNSPEAADFGVVVTGRCYADYLTRLGRAFRGSERIAGDLTLK